MKSKISSASVFLSLLLIILANKQASSQVFCAISAVQNECCNGGNNGYITVAPSGGNSPYTYMWTPSGETTITATMLTAGTYTVVVKDALGNASTCSATVTEPSPLTTSSMFVDSNTNCVNPNGSISVMAVGGTLPYTYTWIPTRQTNSTATGLAAGTYTCNVTDNNCCLSTVSVIITGAAAPMITIYTTPDSISCNGTASTIITGGISPFTYKWSPGGQTSSSISGQCAGNYCCKVTDHAGCQDSSCATILTSTPIVTCACSNAVSFVTQLNSPTLQVNIFPNPVKNILNVSITGISAQADLQLTDMLGRTVTSIRHIQVTNGSKETINIEGLQPGIYFLTIESNGQKLVKKVTKL
ncbi:MAG TPA: T9SS type A sorting domain-containing protein [Bacteroidia bacterium]|jgi:hypothetical protein|nr:T9SS type A sorting domain-containing protein [Bacteroidia bacterium]